MHSPCPSSRGFTLLELIVVIVIISIFTTLAMPRLTDTALFDQLKTASRKISGIVMETGQEAVRARANYLMVIDMNANSVRAGREEAEETGFGAQGFGPEQQNRFGYTLPDSVRIVDVATAHGGKQGMGEVELRFSHKGYVDKTHIHLQDEDGHYMTIMISPFLGVIEVRESYVELSDS